MRAVCGSTCGGYTCTREKGHADARHEHAPAIGQARWWYDGWGHPAMSRAHWPAWARCAAFAGQAMARAEWMSELGTRFARAELAAVLTDDREARRLYAEATRAAGELVTLPDDGGSS